MTFANQSDFISFRHHVYQKVKENVQIAEVGPRFEMKCMSLWFWKKEDCLIQAYSVRDQIGDVGRGRGRQGMGAPPVPADCQKARFHVVFPFGISIDGTTIQLSISAYFNPKTLTIRWFNIGSTRHAYICYDGQTWQRVRVAEAFVAEAYVISLNFFPEALISTGRVPYFLTSRLFLTGTVIDSNGASDKDPEVVESQSLARSFLAPISTETESLCKTEVHCSCRVISLLCFGLEFRPDP